MRLFSRLSSSSQLFFHNPDKWAPATRAALLEACPIILEFVTPVEEQNLMHEIGPHMKRLPYEKTHWDNAISLYREREMRRWSDENRPIIERIVTHSFGPVQGDLASYSVHVLDLHPDGYISPHIDAEAYCGDTVSGLSLLSDCVMRLRHKEMREDLVVDLHLPRLSLYKLSGMGRYDFTHEVLENQTSVFGKTPIPRSRRVSIICRDISTASANLHGIKFTPVGGE